MDLCLLWFALATANPPTAPPPESLTISVGLEAYYQFNWNRPFDRVNPLRAYDTRSKEFSLQQASLVVERTPDVAAGRRVGGRLDLQFGQATETVQGHPANEPRPAVYRHVWQAYGSYVFDVGRGLQLDAGKFASNLGFETNYAKDNSQFSRAYLFNFLPFYHMGARVTLPVSDHVTVMYMLTNGVQQTEDFNDFKSHHVTAVVTPSPRLSWTTSYYTGREQAGSLRVFDTCMTFAATPRLSFGADINVASSGGHQADDARSLQGTALYGRLEASARTVLSLRYERLDDEGLFAGVAQLLQEMTATVEYQFEEGFRARVEVRRDWSNRALFTGTREGDLRNRQTTALIGLVWWLRS